MEHPCAVMVLGVEGRGWGWTLGLNGAERWQLVPAGGVRSSVGQISYSQTASLSPPLCGGFGIAGPSLGLCRGFPLVGIRLGMAMWVFSVLVMWGQRGPTGTKDAPQGSPPH